MFFLSYNCLGSFFVYLSFKKDYLQLKVPVFEFKFRYGLFT